MFSCDCFFRVKKDEQSDSVKNMPGPQIMIMNIKYSHHYSFSIYIYTCVYKSLQLCIHMSTVSSCKHLDVNAYFVNTCMDVCMYTYTSVFTYVQMYIYIYMLIYIYIYMCRYMYECLHVYIYICIYIRAYVYIHVHIYIYVYICINLNRCVNIGLRMKKKIISLFKYIYIFM